MSDWLWMISQGGFAYKYVGSRTEKTNHDVFLTPGMSWLYTRGKQRNEKIFEKAANILEPGFQGRNARDNVLHVTEMQWATRSPLKLQTQVRYQPSVKPGAPQEPPSPPVFPLQPLEGSCLCQPREQRPPLPTHLRPHCLTWHAITCKSMN